MKFFNFGLFTLSAFIATSAAAPAPQSPATIPDLTFKVPELSVPDGKLETRTDGHVSSLVKSCVGEVKKHTAKINSTMSGVTGSISYEDKAGVITLVHTEVTVIISLVTNLSSEVLGLVGTTLNAVEQEELVQLVLELIFEIVYTLENVIAILKISIFELLGNLVFGVLVTVGHLLVILNLIVDGLLKVVFDVLGDIVGLLSIVLSGLLPIVLGVVGGVLGKVGGIVSCIL